MSRIGKKEIIVPNDLKICIDQKDKIGISDGKINSYIDIPNNIEVEFKDDKINVIRKNEDKQTKALHGLVRSLVSNTLKGFKTPFERSLEIKGIGFKANVVANKLTLNVGYSHPVEYEIPEGIEIFVDAKANTILIKGKNKLKVGEVASKIRAIRPPEPYKGTGLIYVGEKVRRKAGKSGAGSGKK